MRFELLCRICLREGTMSSIFTTREMFEGKLVSCNEMLLACAAVTVSESDGYPSKICDACFKNLCVAYQFRRLCEESFSLLLKHSDLTKAEIKYEVADTCDTVHGDIANNAKIFSIRKKERYDNGQNVSPLDENDALVDEKKSPKQSEEESERDIECDENAIKKTRQTLKKGKLKGKRRSQFLPCSLCSKTFKWKYLLLAHMDTHNKSKDYYCETCRKCYKSEKDHMKMHQQGNVCETCARSFNTKSKLRAHKVTHSANRERLVCDVEGCEKTFISIIGLERHSATHIGIKNFICQFCSKSFIDKYQLEVHIRMHTNERPHNCSFCSKTFITSSARLYHERRHTKTKKYKCSCCDKTFVTSTGRNRHILTHSKEQLQSCKFCLKMFSSLDSKKRHETAIHGLSNNKVSIDFQTSGFY